MAELSKDADPGLSPEYRAIKDGLEEWEIWEALDEVDRCRRILDKYAAFQWFQEGQLPTLAHFRHDPQMWGEIRAKGKEIGVSAWDLEKAVDAYLATHLNGTVPADVFPTPQTATELLSKQFDPLIFRVQDIVHEGLILLAGKPKKGKSYLALDMSLAIAVGRLAFRHFPTRQGRVLYVSLEDGERRLQNRLYRMQPNLTNPPGLDFLYAFPRLGAGALEALTHYASQYAVIIVDVLGRILPSIQTVRTNVSEYQEITETLGGIQSLANRAHVAIILIDHVRKAGADDVFDTIMGSMGKWGTADIGLVYERKGEEKDAVLHVAGRDVEEQKFVLTLTDGHLEYLGKGEAYELDSEQNRIIKILEEEHRAMSIPELMKALGIGDAHYSRFRKVMQRLYNDDRIGRTKKRGLFTLYGHDRFDADEGPFS